MDEKLRENDGMINQPDDSSSAQDDILTELFGDYVDKSAKEEPQEVKMYDNYDTDEIPVEEIVKAEADMEHNSSFEDNTQEDEGYLGYAPRNVQKEEVSRTYVDLDTVLEDNAGKSKKRKVFANKKLLGGILGAVATVAIIVGAVFAWVSNIDPLADYTQLTVGRGSVVKSVAVKGALEVHSKYEIFPLVSGTITEAPAEAGESVRKGELLYKIDDSQAELAVKRAKNDVERAKAVKTDSVASTTEEFKIYAPATGVLSDLGLKTGTTINGGSVGLIIKEDETIVPVITGARGVVRSVSASEGQSVIAGQLIATVRNTVAGQPSQTTAASRAAGIVDAEIGVDIAENMLEDYTIESPVSGTVLTVNGKVGDNVIAGGSKPLMVVADMSKMKLVIKVDELDVASMDEGQEVIVTAKALPEETFYGEITTIAGEGVVGEDGITTYDVEITVEDTDALRAGMNVTAKIILDSATNVLTVPEDALINPDGESAYVLVKNMSEGFEDMELEDPMDFTAPDAEEFEDDFAEEEEENFPEEAAPEGCSWVRVEYGVSDGANVEILSGLREGDIVVYKRIDPLPEYNNEPEASADPEEEAYDAESDKIGANEEFEMNDDEIINMLQGMEDDKKGESDNKKNSPSWLDARKEDDGLTNVG